MRITKEGWAVIEGDAYLSADIEREGRLDVAREALEQYRKYIPEGGTVLDVGACLGDYTATFSDFVGPTGYVVAIEPNPPVHECALYNLKRYTNVVLGNCALGAMHWNARFEIDAHNIGASWLVRDDKGPIAVVPLDEIWHEPRLDFVKIDAEGYEPFVLDGARETLLKLRPVLLVEIDQRALGFQGFTPYNVHSRLTSLGYHFEKFDGAHGDILCLPAEKWIQVR